MWPAIMPELKIILGNEDDYVIANGLKCFLYVYYNSQSDMLGAMGQLTQAMAGIY